MPKSRVVGGATQMTESKKLCAVCLTQLYEGPTEVVVQECAKIVTEPRPLCDSPDCARYAGYVVTWVVV
jgi:hypothetical protein